LAAGTLVFGCSGASQPEGPPSRNEEALWFGSITVNLREATETKDAVGVVSGTVYDGPSPIDLWMESVLEAGECQLREPVHAFCDPPCESSSLCVQGGECMAYPRSQNAGAIEITGLDQPVTLEPFPPSYFYQSDELSFPPCEQGALVRLAADDFEAETPCVAPLVVDAGDVPLVRREQPVTLTWQAPGDPGSARIQILLDISHHGGKKGDVVCSVPDTGRYEIPETLVTPLVDLGLAGYPSIILTRLSSAAASPPAVAFSVASAVQRPVDTGVTSCLPNSADECPDGETCDPNSNLCR
jgi:hypothetical protein